MSTLIVTAHPDPESLTHHAASRLRDRLGAGDATVAHLAQEGFDPRFTAGDRERYRGGDAVDPIVTAEQERIDGATDLVLVFPVWWWSTPALLKGWIDRVFIAGWAFEYGDGGRVVPSLGRLTVHLLPLSGTAEESFARHGYADAFRTQLEVGVVDFCGARRGETAFVWESESEDREAVARVVDAAVDRIAAAVSAGRDR